MAVIIRLSRISLVLYNATKRYTTLYGSQSRKCLARLAIDFEEEDTCS